MDYTKWIIKLIVLLIIFSSGSIIAQCPDANETHNLKSQADVDEFLATNPNCTYIRELELSGDISDISGFSTLTSVSYLYIDDCPNLTNLMAFSNIDSIFDNLGFYSVEGLTNLCGLTNLSYIGRDLRLEGTKSIVNLNGLENLTFIGDDISIDENEKLENLNGLQNVQSLTDGNGIIIRDNPMLTNCCGIQNIVMNTINFGLGIENTPSFCSSLEDIISADCEFPVTECITNTKEEAVFDIKVYPNPASNYLLIENNDTRSIDQLLLYNSIGQKVVQIKNPSTIVPIDQLPNGIYIVEIRMGEKRILDKIIIEN